MTQHIFWQCLTRMDILRLVGIVFGLRFYYVLSTLGGRYSNVSQIYGSNGICSAGRSSAAVFCSPVEFYPMHMKISIFPKIDTEDLIQIFGEFSLLSFLLSGILPHKLQSSLSSSVQLNKIFSLCLGFFSLCWSPDINYRQKTNSLIKLI